MLSSRVSAAELERTVQSELSAFADRNRQKAASGEKKKKAAVSVSMNTVFSMGHVTTKVIYEQLFYYGILPDN